MIPARLYRQSCVCLSSSLLSRSRIHKTVRPSWTGLESFYDRHYASKAVACRPWTVIYHLYSQSPSADKRDGLIERREIKLFSLSSMRRAHMCIYETVAKYIQLSLVDNELQGFASTNLDDRRPCIFSVAVSLTVDWSGEITHDGISNENYRARNIRESVPNKLESSNNAKYVASTHGIMCRNFWLVYVCLLRKVFFCNRLWRYFYLMTVTLIFILIYHRTR